MTQKRILIYLHTEQTSWCILDEHGQIQQSTLHGNLTDLAPFAKNSEIDVIVPGDAVLLTTAKLPKLNAQRAIQAIPFALEEQLIDDINALHFATGEYQLNNSFPVAVVSKEKMNHWLDELKQANIVPLTFTPTTLVLPFTTGQWYACIDNEISTVRTGLYSCFTCDRENLAVFLELALADEKEKPECIHIYNFSDTPASISLETTKLNEIILTKNQFLDYMAKWRKTPPPINLLQGPYQTKTQSSTTQKIWAIASCLAIAWIGCAFVSNIGSFLILHHTIAASEQSIDAIYYRHFPHASSVVAPRQRMEETLKKLHASTNKNTFLSLLAIISNSLNQNEIQLMGIDLIGNQLSLSISATAFKDLDTLTQALIHQGLNVKQQNARTVGTTVQTTLLINQGIL